MRVINESVRILKLIKYYYLLLMLLVPLSIKAQCVEKTPIAWQNSDGAAWMNEDGTLWIGNDSVTTQKPCKGKAFVFYPNPTQDELRCQNTEGVDTLGDWQIFDVQGRSVLHIKNTKLADVSSLGQAVYIVRLDFTTNKKADWILSKFIKL